VDQKALSSVVVRHVGPRWGDRHGLLKRRTASWKGRGERGKKCTFCRNAGFPGRRTERKVLTGTVLYRAVAQARHGPLGQVLTPTRAKGLRGGACQKTKRVPRENRDRKHHGETKALSREARECHAGGSRPTRSRTTRNLTTPRPDVFGGGKTKKVVVSTLTKDARLCREKGKAAVPGRSTVSRRNPGAKKGCSKVSGGPKARRETREGGKEFRKNDPEGLPP